MIFTQWNFYEAERTGLAHQDAALTKREGTIARISSTSCARSTLLSESRHRLAIICYKSIKNPRDGKVANPQKMMGKNQITFLRTHATFCGFRQNKVKTFCGFRHIRTKTFYGFRQNKVKTFFYSSTICPSNRRMVRWAILASCFNKNNEVQLFWNRMLGPHLIIWILYFLYQSDVSPDGILYLGNADILVCTMRTRWLTGT